MSASLSPWLKPRFFITGTNRPLAGGLMYTYEAGTTTNATTYSDDSGTPNTNPIVLNSDGECNLYLDDDVIYRILLKNAAGVTQFDKDNISANGAKDAAVLSFENVANLRLAIGNDREPTAQTSGYYNAGDGGGNSFYWDGTSGATDNGGTIIKPTLVSGAGRWLAVNPYVCNVRQFGAKGDGLTDASISIQKALDYCHSVGISCFMTSGVFRTGSTIYVPWGVDFYGSGTRENSSSLPTIIKPLDSFTNGDIIRVKNTGTVGTRLFWAGKIRDMHLRGNTAATSQWGISFRDSTGAIVAIQDTALIADLLIWGCYSGGIELPNAALPLMISRIKLLWNNGYGIKLTSGANLAQSLNFTDISGDGNNGGLLYFNGLDANGSLTIINLKSERRVNNDYGSIDAQENAIVFENCNNTPVTIVGATHISSVPDGASFKKPSDFIKILAGQAPRLDWHAVAIRVRGTDTGADPFIISSGLSSVPYQQMHGYFNNSGTFGFYSSSSTLKGVFGTGGAFVPCGPADTVWQVQGSTPSISLHEYDANTNEKTWSMDASSGALRLRAVDDSGTATILLTIDRLGGTALKIESAIPIAPSVYTIAGLPAPSTATNSITMVSNPAGGKGRLVYSDGAIWFYVSDNTAV